MTGRPASELAAHQYADAGWPVFPARPGGKEPLIPSAHPAGDPQARQCRGECGREGHGLHDAVTSHQQISRWWSRTPDANVAIATGAPGPDVLDIDVHTSGAGWPALNRLKRAGLVPAPTAIIRTPSGGAHLYFRGSDQRNGSLPRHHLDHRGTGGYVIAPPSTTGGRAYEVVQHRAASNGFDWSAARNLLEPPQPRPARQASASPGPGELARLAQWVARQEPGNRSQGLYWAACRAAEKGLLDPCGAEVLVDAALQAGIVGGEREARQKIDYARTAPGLRLAGPDREAEAG